MGSCMHLLGPFGQRSGPQVLLCAQEYMKYLTGPEGEAGARLTYLLRFCQRGRPYRALRFTRHVRKARCITAMAKSLLDPHTPRRTLVGWGDRGRAGGGFVRSQCGPSDRVVKALKTMCTVVIIDEFRTSKVGPPDTARCLHMAVAS